MEKKQNSHNQEDDAQIKSASFTSSIPEPSEYENIVEKYANLFKTIVFENVKFLFDPEYIYEESKYYDSSIPDDFRHEPYKVQTVLLSLVMTTYCIRKLLGKNYRHISRKYLSNFEYYISHCNYTNSSESINFYKSRIDLYYRDYIEYTKDSNNLRALTIHAIYFVPIIEDVTIDSCFLNHPEYKDANYMVKLFSYNIKLKHFEKALQESLKIMCDSYLSELKNTNKFVE